MITAKTMKATAAAVGLGFFALSATAAYAGTPMASHHMKRMEKCQALGAAAMNKHGCKRMMKKQSQQMSGGGHHHLFGKHKMMQSGS